MADLGTTYPKEPLSPPKNEVMYPSLMLEDETLDEVKGSHECAVGDEYTGTVTLRVKSVAEDEDGGQRVTFDIVDLSDFAAAEGTYEEETETEEAEEPEVLNGGKVPKALRLA